MASDFQQINDYNFNIDSFVQGNNGAVLRFNVRRKGNIVPIDNATVNVAIKRGNDLFTKNATIVSATSGICEVKLTRADLETAGTYYLQPTIIFPDDDEFSGDVQKFVVSGKLTGAPTNPGNGGTNPVFTVRDSAINGNIIVNGGEMVVYDDAGKVDKVTGKGLSTNDYDNIEKAEVAKVKGKADKSYVDDGLLTKVDKVAGKGLSTNDYDNAEKAEVTKVKDKANQTDLTALDNKVGVLSNLTTTDKTSLVNAVNSTAAQLADNATLQVLVESYKRLAVEITDSGRIQRALNDSVGKTTVFSPIQYLVSEVISVPNNVNMLFQQGCLIKATSAITAIFQTSLTQQMRNNYIIGGTIDCNGLANIGIDLRNFAHVSVSNMIIQNFQEVGLKLGDIAASGTSFEGMIFNVKSTRTGGVGQLPVSSKSLWITNGSDHKLLNCIFGGAETGIRNDGSGNHFTNVHCWNWVGAGQGGTGWMKIAFDDNGAHSIYTSCYADTVQQYGFRVRGNQPVQIIGCRVYNNSVDGVDNDGTDALSKSYNAVYFDNTTPTANIIGLQVLGENATHRIYKDIGIVSGGDLGNVTIIGVRTTNVINIAGGRARIGNVDSLRAFGYVFTDGNAGNEFRSLYVGTNGKYRWKAGSDTSTEDGTGAGTNFEITAFADDGTTKTQVMKIDRKSKTPMFPNLATAANDGAAATAGVPVNGLYKDSTGVIRIRLA
jgi:hypothetical protein